jgi:hypothetical protein
VASVLPDFGEGIHLPNVMPGSAPDSFIYWLKGALILVADALDVDSLKAAVAKVTDFGRNSGYKTFDALVTDIPTFALVRVSDEDVV